MAGLGEIFAQNLKAARIKAGFTQLSLAHKIGVAPSSISEWENGNKEPRFDVIGMICETLGIRPTSLFFEREDIADLAGDSIVIGDSGTLTEILLVLKDINTKL